MDLVDQETTGMEVTDDSRQTIFDGMNRSTVTHRIGFVFRWKTFRLSSMRIEASTMAHANHRSSGNRRDSLP